MFRGHISPSCFPLIILLASHVEEKSASSLSVCLSSSSSPSSAAEHPVPLAACVHLSQQINHSSPGGWPLCGCKLPCLLGNYVLRAASVWPCSDTAELFWLCSKPHCSTFHFLHELFSRQRPPAGCCAAMSSINDHCFPTWVPGAKCNQGHGAEEMDWFVSGNKIQGRSD